MNERQKRIVIFILKGILVYILIIGLFGLLYQKTGSIHYSGSNGKTVTEYSDCFYFSFISFQTIGYGDIIPASSVSKSILFFETIFSFLFVGIFSGFLVYYSISRPKDIFTTDNYFIRYANNKFLLSIRVGNKGEELIDCKIKVEVLRINDKQIRTRVSKKELDFSVLETTWYADFEMSRESNINVDLLEAMQKIAEGENWLLRCLIMGVDSRSGSPIAYLKYYKPEKLKYGTNFLHVLDWDKTLFKRSALNWSNFNQVQPLSKELIENFKSM